MLSQRLLSRASARLGAGTSRTSNIRQTIPRRFASEGGPSGPKLEGAADNAFNRERAAVKAHAAASTDLWRKLSIYAVIPCLVWGSINAYNLWNEHWEHWEHMPPLEERTEYAYQNIRTKNYFWGDGDKTLFWNSNVNYHKKSDDE